MQISATITKQKTDQPAVNGHLKAILWPFFYILLIYLCNIFYAIYLLSDPKQRMFRNAYSDCIYSIEEKKVLDTLFT